MKNIIILAGIIIILGTAVIFIQPQKKDTARTPSTPSQNTQTATASATQKPDDIPAETTIVENLDTPWGLVFLPDKTLLITERRGTVQKIDSNGNLDSNFATKIQQVKEIGEGGLLGITIHPDFSTNHFVYLYYTYSTSGDDTLNRVVRMTYTDNKLQAEKIIVDNIPGASNHNGGRIKFGPDNYLYIGTGDAQNPSQAQNTKTLGGKILRVTDEGKPAPGNPFNNEVYSYGHRNVQGLTWDKNGRLWTTEHGRSGIQSGYDEINLIEKGKNYGWPDIEGDKTKAGMQSPKKHSGATSTWAPSGIAFLNNSLFFGGLRGQTLYEAVIQDDRIVDFKEHLSGKYGRLRDVIVGPDGMLYVTTSNRDGRGTPNATDDKVIRINPAKL